MKKPTLVCLSLSSLPLKAWRHWH